MYQSRAFYFLLSLLAGCTSAVAQNANDVFRLFGGLMQTAIIQATIDQWRKVPEKEVVCVDQELLQRGSSLRALISQGISPSAPQVASIRSYCSARLAGQSPSSGPSFNCAKATYADERAICSNNNLSQLDNAVAKGYEYVREKYGDQYARSINLPMFQARRACGSDVSCIKERQLEAIRKFEALGAPSSSPIEIATNQSSHEPQRLWNHNGSTVYLVAQGRSRKFYYKEPRPGMLSAGAKPGSLLFEGEANGSQYQGTAYIFQARCDPYPYRVSGPILDNYRRVELRGQAPRVESDCRISGYFSDLLEFELIDPEGQNPSGDTKTSPQASEQNLERFNTTKEKALKGDAEAQFNLGVMYAGGEGVTKNETEAVAWIRKAADQGLPSAQKGIGDLCYFGLGVNKDQAQAAAWYRKASEQGDAEAQYKLGLLYASGEGVEKSSALATEWMQKASTKGLQQARNWLDQQATQARLLQEARDKGFETVDEYEQFKAEQNKLAKSGIRLKSR